MDQPAEGVKPAKPAAPWIRGNLVTLGSAAVFTVYSAGYFRTREAADRFAGESVQRRAAVAATPASSAGRANARSAPVPDSSTRLPVMQLSSPANAGSANVDKRSAPKAAVAPARAADSATEPSPATAPVPAVAGAATAAQSSPSAAMASAPAASAPPATPQTPPAPPAPAASPAPAALPASQPESPAAPAADSAEPAAANASGQLKDGTYYGWGTSRHGDIQASVEVKSGKIVGAYIAQCLTRYSCSWISALPPQVLQRQSAEVDYVSGATQSSNAFYYAVAEALKKAK